MKKRLLDGGGEGQELVHVFGLGRPRAHEARERAAVGQHLEDLAACRLGEGLRYILLEEEELLVGRRIARRLEAQLDKSLTQLEGALVGTARELPIERLAVLVLLEGDK